MSWKKVAESNELIILEKSLKNYKLKIEARKNHNVWEIFKTKVNGESSNLISEYTLDNKKEVKELINKLKNEEFSGLKIKGSSKNKGLGISLKRVFKEEFVEKWFFNIGNNKIKNFILIRFDKEISVDIVLNDKYRPYEKKLLPEIEDMLGLRELGESINYDIYYFKKQNLLKSSQKGEEYNVDVFDIDFDNQGEDGVI
jgi:hypothetical protein